jgi:hypothetical protein
MALREVTPRTAGIQPLLCIQIAENRVGDSDTAENSGRGALRLMRI